MLPHGWNLNIRLREIRQRRKTQYCMTPCEILEQQISAFLMVTIRGLPGRFFRLPRKHPPRQLSSLSSRLLCAQQVLTSCSRQQSLPAPAWRVWVCTKEPFPRCLLRLAVSWLKSGFPGGSDSKESTCNAGDPGSIPGSGRCPGEENGNPLQYSCLGNPMDRGPGRIAKCQTRLRNQHIHRLKSILRALMGKN